MATIRERRRSDGTVSHAVLFRQHGRQRSLTFDDPSSASHFVKMIDVLGVDQAVAEAKSPANAHTVDQLAELFFAYKETRVRSDRTVADYRRDYRNWIKPRLGHMASDAVDETDVQDLVDAMAAKLSPKSVADRHAILHGIYAWALAPSRKLVARNPTLGTDLPKRRRRQPKGLRPAEWQALYRALRKIDIDAADFALFLLASGWRFSEAAGVDVFDVEDDGKTVHVTMGRVLRRNGDNQFVVVEDGKSDAAIRRVQLDKAAGEMVRRRIGGKTSGPVFTTAQGARIHYSHFRERAWDPAVKAAKLSRSPTPHWLRHTHVAWMVLGRKVTLPELQRRIGHESIQTTINVYGRMIEDVSPEALDAFAAIRDADGLRPLDPASAAGPQHDLEQT